MDNTILVISAPSGAGKDTLSHLVADELGFNFVKSTTTRPMRPYESQGDPYWFVTQDEYFKLEFIENREYYTLLNGVPDVWYYGVTKDAIEEDKRYIVVLDLQGTQEFINHFGKRVLSVYLNVDAAERHRRSIARGGHDEIEWERRLLDDQSVFDVHSVQNTYDYIIDNYNLENSLDKIRNILNNA